MKARQAAIFLAVAAIVSALYLGGVWQGANLAMQDALYAPGAPLQEIVIVAIDDRALQETGRWPWDRGVWASAIGKIAPNAKAVGIDVSFLESGEGDAELQEALSKYGNIVLAAEYSDGKFLKPVFNASYGFVNVFTDLDGVTRSVPVRLDSTYAFSYAVLEKYLGSAPGVPEELMQRMRVNFYGKPGSYRQVSFADINDVTEELSDRIVLIGATAQDLQDRVTAPISGIPMPGVEFHANAVQTLLFGSFLRVQDAYSSIIAIFLLSAAAGFALSRWKLVRATIAVAAITAAYTAASFAAFDSGLILTMLYPMLSAALTYVATVGYSYATESRQRKQVTDIFGKYVSADIVKELLKNPDQIKLGGKRKEMTIMFSDIRGFTALSERMKPEELVHFMNDYLTAMSSIVMRNRGVVDKYIGDAIMAFWGAPLDDPAHAEKALAAAVEMIAGLEKFRAGRKNIGLSIGIGINSGPAVVGNMGSEQRFSYTAMGDTVNLASRLEGLNKEYGTCIIASEESFRQAMPKFFGRELDLVRVKGKQKPVRIFEIMAKSGEETEKQKEIRRFFESGLGLYRKRKWSAAIKEFSKAERLGDRASGKFIGRCRALSRERLPRGWDGVFEAKTK